MRRSNTVKCATPSFEFPDSSEDVEDKSDLVATMTPTMAPPTTTHGIFMASTLAEITYCFVSSLIFPAIFYYCASSRLLFLRQFFAYASPRKWLRSLESSPTQP
ncbi:hypothetical protein V7S43_001674 [Phytophthora oleae]|uniref:Uncharacterized protein n=1 Tax=Phytophthora oleae TaxID=2107226 RepID=A0ABD3G850_9STRA